MWRKIDANQMYSALSQRTLKKIKIKLNCKTENGKTS